MAGINMVDWPKNRHILHLKGKLMAVLIMADWPKTRQIIPAINIPPKVVTVTCSLSADVS